METKLLVAGVAGVGAVTAGVIWWMLRPRPGTEEILHNPTPKMVLPPTGPIEAEPEFDWNSVYTERFGDALRECCEDRSIVSFDRAVVGLLERVFPTVGSFDLRPGLGAWKRSARARARRAFS